MSDFVVASGQQIYDAAMEGVKKKFNRNIGDQSRCASMLHDFYEMMLDDPSNKAECERVRQRTKNNWRNANFPITLLMFHKHRDSQSCETHARVCLMGNYEQIFDISMDYWELFEAQASH